MSDWSNFASRSQFGHTHWSVVFDAARRTATSRRGAG